MSDTAGGAYVGYKPQRATPRNEVAARRLDALLRGYVGEELGGSVLDRDPAEEDLRSKAELAGFLPFGPGELTAGAKALGPMLAGMLRRGGRKDLILTHSTHMPVDSSGNLLKELTNPSMAVSQDAVHDVFGPLKLVAQPDRFDPRRSPSTLFSRDASTIGLSQANPDLHSLDLKTRAMARLESKFLLPHQAPIDIDTQTLRTFPSFKAYENNQYGAKLLEGNWDHWEAARQQLEKVKDKGSKEAYQYLSWLRKEPQSISELKAYGEIPVNKESFAGALVPHKDYAGLSAQQHTTLLEQLRARGIKSLEYNPDTTPNKEMFDMSSWLQRKASE